MRNYRCRAHLHPGSLHPWSFESQQNRQLGSMQRPLRSVSLPQDRWCGPSVHSRLRSSHTPTHIAHTKRSSFHLWTPTNLGTRSSQNCTPHIPSPPTNQLHSSCPHHLCRRHLTNCHRVPALPMQRQEPLHLLFCMLRLNNTRWLWIPFFSAEAWAIQTVPSVVLAQSLPDWC